MVNDLRDAWRATLRAPGHFLAAIICLIIGMAVCVASFSAIDAFLFGDLPGIANRSGIVLVRLAKGGSLERFSTADFDLLASMSGPAWQSVAAEGICALPLARDGNGRIVRGAFVSGGYFDVLGTRSVQGRLLRPADDRPNAAPVVVVGHDLWTLILGGRDDVVGSVITLKGRAFTIVGVVPPRFAGALIGEPGRRTLTDTTQFWVPLHHAASFAGLPAPDVAWHTVVGRLAPNRRLSEARAAAGAVAAAIDASRGTAHPRPSIVMQSLDPGDTPVQALGAIVLFMLLPLSVMAVACANVANLQLARATDRARELGVRIALGASRLQVMRPLILEAGGAAGVAAACAWMIASVALRRAEPFFPFALRLDGRVFLFAMLLVAGVISLAGCVPAWLTVRRSAAVGVNEAPRSGRLAHARLRNGLVALQVALSLVLIFVAALAVRSLGAISASMPPEVREVVGAQLNLTEIDATPIDTQRVVRTLLERLAADRRVAAAGAADGVRDIGLRYWLPDDPPAVRRSAAGGAVTSSWFGVVGARPVAGRLLNERDAGSPVAVVSSELAEFVAPGGRVIGRRVRLQRSPEAPVETVEIVGVVRNPLPRIGGEGLPTIYLPMGASVPATVSIFFRARAHAPAVLGGARPMLADLDPRLRWTAWYTLADLLDVQGVAARYLAWIFGSLGALALLLATAGLYAVIAYVVSLRVREIGIRVALGARRRVIMSLVLRQSIRLVSYGAAAGLLVAIPLAFAMRAVIVGVAPVDPLALGEAGAVLLLAGLAAAAVPARHAAGVDPLIAIRHE